MPTQTLHRLFFAIKPAVTALPLIDEARREYCAGRPVRDEHAHITMEIFDDRLYAPTRLIDALIGVGDAIDETGFQLSLARVVGTVRSVALRPGKQARGLAMLQRAIDEGVRRAGRSVRQGWQFSPHLTLGYRDGAAFARAIPPIAWPVDEFVLIHSFVGETRHDIVKRWPLAPELPLFQ